MRTTDTNISQALETLYHKLLYYANNIHNVDINYRRALELQCLCDTIFHASNVCSLYTVLHAISCRLLQTC